MEKMNNVIVDRAERGKSGQESWGTWQAWSVWFVGLQPKFDYFERDNVVPFPGMQVDFAEYTVEQAGRHTNYKLKKLVPAQLAGSPVPLGSPVQVRTPSPVAPAVVDYEKEKRLTMCTSYAKDLMAQMLLSGDYKEEPFKAIIEMVAKGGKLLAKRLGEKSDVMLEPGVPLESVAPMPTIPEPSVLMPEVAVTPGMTEAANKVLVTPPYSMTPEKNIPNDNVPF